MQQAESHLELQLNFTVTFTVTVTVTVTVTGQFSKGRNKVIPPENQQAISTIAEDASGDGGKQR